METHRRAHEHGVTVIELMIAVTLVMVLGSIAVLGSRALSESYNLRSAAREFFSDMQLARLSAIKEGRVWALCLTPGDNLVTSYTIRNRPGVDDIFCTADDGAAAAPRKTVSLTGYQTLTITENFAGTSLLFNPNGTASAGAVTVTKTDGAALNVVVNASTGNIRIQ